MTSLITQRSRKQMEQFLQERNEHPERAAELDAEIRKVFAQTLAILIMDMSGFSRQTLRHGIIHFLAQIHRMHAIAAPIVTTYGGELIKREADNIFAIFPDLEQAVSAAVALDAGLEAANTMLPDEYDMHGEFGIGYGEILVVENEDMFGSEVNLASKLGEDIAQRSEILLTESAYAQADSKVRQYQQLKMQISGIDLIAYQLKKPGAVDENPASKSD
jgi:adenylate cyclase